MSFARSDMPSLAQVIAMIRNTVRCQFRNSREGQRLCELDLAAVDSLEDQLTNNVSQVVKGLIEQVTGVDY